MFITHVTNAGDSKGTHYFVHIDKWLMTVRCRPDPSGYVSLKLPGTVLIPVRQKLSQQQQLL